MKRHRFDPFSFLFGAVFLGVALAFLFGEPGEGSVRPTRLWPAAVAVIGLTLVVWAASRAFRPGSLGTDGAVTTDLEHPELELFPPATGPEGEPLDGEEPSQPAGDDPVVGDRADAPENEGEPGPSA